MALYVKPPKGGIGFHKLCDYVRKRLVFLHFIRGKSAEEISLGVEQNTLAVCSECLIEGSLKDRISHFVLRLLCSVRSDLRNFFIQAETELFIYRLKFYELSDIRRLMKDSLKKSIDVCQQHFIIKSYINVLKSLIMVAQDMTSDLGKQYIKVPFTAALNFVEKRLYPLCSGYVEVPLHAVRSLLAIIFEEMLVQGLNQMTASNCMQELKDPRMNYLHEEITKWFTNNVVVPSVTVSKNIIMERDLDHESENFPLCMANLHHLLRRNHRLQHNSRVQYILYLKEIGVPSNETITLFMKEYSVPVCDKNAHKFRTCNHSWDDSKNRYIYSIEHLYGKRGSRKNYNAHSCCTLQASGNSSDGGCPFACFDEDNLVKALQPCSCEIGDIEDIKSLTLKKKYAEACYLHFLTKVRRSASTSQEHKVINVKVSDQNEMTNVEFSSTSEKSVTKIDINEDVPTNHFVQKMSKPSDFFFLLKNVKQTTDFYS